MNDTPPPTRRHDPDHADQKSAMDQLAAQAETVERSGAAPWWFPRDSVTNGADHVHVSVEGHGDGDGLPITGAAGGAR